MLLLILLLYDYYYTFYYYYYYYYRRSQQQQQQLTESTISSSNSLNQLRILSRKPAITITTLATSVIDTATGTGTAATAITSTTTSIAFDNIPSITNIRKKKVNNNNKKKKYTIISSLYIIICLTCCQSFYFYTNNTPWIVLLLYNHHHHYHYYKNMYKLVCQLYHNNNKHHHHHHHHRNTYSSMSVMAFFTPSNHQRIYYHSKQRRLPLEKQYHHYHRNFRSLSSTFVVKLRQHQVVVKDPLCKTQTTSGVRCLYSTSNNSNNINENRHHDDNDALHTTTTTSTDTSSSSTNTIIIPKKNNLKLAFESQLIEAKRMYDTTIQLYQQNLLNFNITKEQLIVRIHDYEIEQSHDTFWNNQNNDSTNNNQNQNSNRVLYVNEQLSKCTQLLNRIIFWETLYGDAQAAYDILMEYTLTTSTTTPTSTTTNTDTNNDISNTNNNNKSSNNISEEERELLLNEFISCTQTLYKDCIKAELEYLLSGPYDDCPARIVITAGAGGIEAMDWVGDLTRMYIRYCERQTNYIVQKIDWTDSFSGYKSMELLVTGPKAYGYLSGEKGSHRLVRISPYNAMGKRQTTFAGVDVTPDLPPSLLGTLSDITIPETELEVTTMRSPGKGGQHVNKVSSGVRMKHIPSGIVVRCTEERSQLANRNIALHRLKAQLLIIAQEQRVQEIKDIRGDIVEASWGTQIRSYVLHPYRQVKDTRTGWETTQTQSFLDGSELLDDCIGTYLRYKADKERKEQMEKDLNQ